MKFAKVAWMLMLMTAFGMAQSQGSSADQTKQMGGYEVEQSVELGYRFVNLNGSEQVYRTFIDQSEGPRLLEQSFSMRSPEHQGVLFDDLSVNSFGWGGDPENVARMRMSKYKLYDFTGMFRRDYNSFDYNLLANPLNFSATNPYVPVPFSPHAMEIRRRMYDFGLTLLPESKLTFRLGYSRNREEGPSFSSFHEGADVLLNQPWNVSQNAYRVGVDFKFLRNTTISYDQTLLYDKNDTDYSLAPFNSFPLAGGAGIVEFGLPFITGTGGVPCATPVLAGGFANPACNGYLAYTRTQRVRTTTPTEQLSLTSNYFKRVNFTGNVSYSAADLNSPYFEFFNGVVTRTNERQFTFSGPATVRQVTNKVDFGVTVQATDSIRFMDTFRYDNFRIPGLWNSVETVTGAAGTPVLITSPLGTTTTTPLITATMLSMKTFENVFRVEYSPTKLFGVQVGYKFRHRRFFHGEPEDVTDSEGVPEPFEGDDITVNEHGPLLNVWLRPTDKLRVNAEVEATTADNFITRISPRQKQQVRGRVNYRPNKWATLATSVNWEESRNGESDTQFAQHYRNAGFIATLFPNERFSLDLSYNYTDALQNAYICYNGTLNPTGSVVNGCPTWTAATNSSNPNPNWIYSNYADNVHYFSSTVMFKPVARLTANVGYGVTKTDGNTTLLNSQQPLGPLQFTYHQPVASLKFDVVKNWSVNAYWNYDQYKEGSFVGPTLPRNFHDNRTVLSMKYAF